MKTPQEIYKERVERLKKTIALEKADRNPIILQTDSFNARHMGVKLADFVKDVRLANKTIIDSLLALGDVDGANGTFFTPVLFHNIFLSKVKLPGVELPDDMLWQVDEHENMTVEDYDRIIEMGYDAFFEDFMTNRLGFTMEYLRAPYAFAAQADQNFQDNGLVVFSTVKTGTVPELFGGGRSMAKFMRDLYKIPDKVEAAMRVVQDNFVNGMRSRIRAAKAANADKHFIVFISPARGASEFFSPKLWERFVWNFLRESCDAIIEEGGVAAIHIDSNWERDLDYFKHFPKGKAVFETDSATPILKVKEVIGDTMCIKGDVPAGLLTLGSEEDVYNYSKKILKDIGNGLILATGCSVPQNAKVENVKAMVAAVTGK